MVQVVTLTSSLTDTSEDRVTTVGLGNIVNELLNKHGLADTGTTEKTNLSTSSVGGEEVDDLDTSLENLSLGRLVDELGSVGVDRGLPYTLDGATLVNGLTNNVHDTTAKPSVWSPSVCKAFYLPEGRRTDGDLDGSTSVKNLLASDKTIGTVHGNASDSVLTQVLSNLKNKSATLGSGLTLTKLNVEGVKDRGEVVRVEVDVNDGTNDGLDRTSLEASGSGVGACSVG